MSGFIEALYYGNIQPQDTRNPQRPSSLTMIKEYGQQNKMAKEMDQQLKAKATVIS